MAEISQLSHATEPLPSGGMVLLLETGAVITPEDTAMLQALHSRSSEGVKSHLERLAKAGSGRFMESFYVGYGHKSIGDCGTITLFIEGISMLAAKALQDSMLYSGQESSTRYIDFSRQPFLDPVNTERSASLLSALRAFYVSSFPKVCEHIAQLFPMKEGEDPATYQKAVNARAFDILRGILPAGATTNIAWHTNLRQAADHIARLRNHPLEEIRSIAESIEKVLLKKYPNSFGHKHYEATEAYVEAFMKNDYLLDPKGDFPDFSLAYDGVERSRLEGYRHLLESRPPKTELPKFVGDSGTVRFEFLLDFGSFRDVQRHRSLVQRMPLVTTRFGFVEWYLESMPEAVRKECRELLSRAETDIAGFASSTPKETLQYYVPMGYAVPVSLSGDLAAWSYVIELRATKFVHPTLQRRALAMADALEERFGTFGFRLFVDHDSFGRFDSGRGSQDIVEKK
jgi:thymidylate synthase ThyX